MADRIDPYGSYRFAVELDGITRAGFRECSGVEPTQGQMEYREGNDKNLAPRKIPALNTLGDLTLSRGITNDKSLWEWHQRVANGGVERHNISIVILNEKGSAQVRWNLFDCWPKAWSGPSLNATGGDVAVEQLTLAYERIETDQWQ